MAHSLRLKRGTTAENDSYIGQDGEISIDTELSQIRLHDGVTLGGTVISGQDGQDGEGPGVVDFPFNIIGVLDDKDELPLPQDATEHDTYIVDGIYWTLIDNRFEEVGTIRGDDGKNAYELAVQNGYRGSLSNWLASLKGSDGIGLKVRGTRNSTEALPIVDNLDGDAYIVNTIMYVWVLDKWVKVGQTGPRGFSAYQLALAHGEINDSVSELEWLESLKGKDAYELAIENGNISASVTRPEWINSLEGDDAYVVATQEGFVGSRDEWLESIRGERGPKGERGSAGPQGEPSNAIKVMGRVNDEESLPQGVEPGDSYYIDRELYVYNGDSYVNVGVVVGEKGEQGDRGPEGLKGDKGDTGRSAYEAAVELDIFVGSEKNWLESLQGRSAYDIAMDVNGYVIPEEDWLDSLKGDDVLDTLLNRGTISDESEFQDYIRGPQGPEGPEGPKGEGLSVLGYVDSTDDLPSRTAQNGDVYSVIDNFMMYQDGEWHNVGSIGGIRIVGSLESTSHLPDNAELGNAYLIDMELYTYTVEGWENLGLVRGPRGLQGPRGDQGLMGRTGEVGPQGPEGAKGDKGDTGPEGPTGEQGPQGIQGEQGSGIVIVGSLDNTSQLPAVGAVGEGYLVDRHLWVNPTGGAWVDAGEIQGPRGLQGPEGPKGEKGDTGPQGIKGVDGHGIRIVGVTDSPTKLPITVAAGDAYLVGVNLYVFANGQWVNTGPVRGPKGETGPKGERGEKGDAGEDGYGIRFIGKGTKEADLPDNPQLYDGFLINQNVWSWTGSSWLDLGVIAGPKGDRGETGDAGPEGPPGPQGATGKTGPRGDRGPKGVRGDRGNDGPRGDAGPEGPAGKGIAVAGRYNEVSELPASWTTGDSGFVIGRNMYLFDPKENEWFNSGPIVGPQGEEGPEGPEGPQGEQGYEGARGPRGSIWIHAAKPPEIIDGEVGDFYINTNTKEYYNKVGTVEWTLLGTIDGSDFVEAPQDGRSYVRRNGYWTPVPVGEAPNDNAVYVRKNGGWVRYYSDVQDAPADDKLYVRKRGTWIPYEYTEAPSDGKQYVRSKKDWKQFNTYDLLRVDTNGVLNLAKSNTFTIDLQERGDVGISFDNSPESDRSMTVVITIIGAMHTVTWPSNINWNNGIPPVLGVGSTVVVLYWTGDQWIGTVGMSY